MRRFLPLLLLALLALAVPSATQASRSQQSIFQDDHSLLGSGDAVRQHTLDELQQLGVNTVRANVVWSYVTRGSNSKTRPGGFNATDPNSSGYSFGEFDALVAEAHARGIDVLLTPTSPAPAWASGCRGSVKVRHTCRPSASEFNQFVTALGRRFPTVHRWSIWNEPNYPSWLTPQWAKHGRKWIPESPRLYRNLVRAATSALAATGHGGDQIMLGETAPLGRNSGPYTYRSNHPADFYRDLFCLSSSGRKLRGSAARVRGCTHFQRLAVNAVAHHPYTAFAGRSPYAKIAAGDITLVHMNRLTLWLNRGARAGRIRRGVPIFNTEYGFQTNPPDRFAGTSLANQAKWINQSDYISWRMSRLASTSQYLLRDGRSLAGFQTGLRFSRGGAKPAYAAYRLPIWPVRTRHGTNVWLQVRPLGGSAVFANRQVTIQYRKGRRGAFRTWKTITVTNARGFAYVRSGIRAAYWRILWNGYASRTAAR